MVTVPAPGHTEGSVVFHIDGRWLLTGDTLHWNHRRGELDVFAGAMFHSWEALADSMDRLATLPVEWGLPGPRQLAPCRRRPLRRADGPAGTGHAPDRSIRVVRPPE